MTQRVVRCSVLGQTEIEAEGIRLTPESERQFGVALYFCANAGRPVARDDVAQLFWPEHSDEAARHCLRQTLYRLRAFGMPVRSSPRGTTLDARVVEADYAPVVAEETPPSAYLGLPSVVVLPGYAPRFSEPFTEWLEGFRSDLSARLRRGLVRAIADARSRGRYADVERLARHCLTLDPLNEEATLALAEAVALAGSKVEAVGMIERYLEEVGRESQELRLPSALLRERIADAFARSYQSIGELPFIGREADVERLVSVLQRLKGEQATSYVLTGQPGVGKTRLARECTRIAELQGARVVRITASPAGRAQSLSTLSDFVAACLRLPGALGSAPSALLALQELSSTTRRDVLRTVDHDGEERLAVVRWSVLDLVDAVCSEAPLCIHLDDAHYADSRSISIFSDIIRTHASRPIFLLISIREGDGVSQEEPLHPLLTASFLHKVHPLSESSCGRIVDAFCEARGEELPAGGREKAVQLSGGNPFFLLELLKHAGELSSHADVPLSVQSLLERRLGQLSSEALNVLRACAVLNTNSELRHVESLVEQTSNTFITALSEVHSHGMILDTGDKIVCRHDLLREAVLKQTPPAVLRILHQRAARILGRSLLRERSVSHLWKCVDHWSKAGRPANGVRLALALVDRLLSLGLASDAIEVLRDTDRAAETATSRARLLIRLARAARMLRDWDLVRDAVARRRQLSLSSGLGLRPHSREELLEFEAAMSSADRFGTVPPAMLECLADPSASPEHRLRAATMVMISADNDANMDMATLAVAAARESSPRGKRQIVAQQTVEMIYHSGFGDLDAAQACADTLLHLANRTHHPVTRSLLLRRVCYAYRRTGHHRRANDLADESLAISRRLSLLPHSILAIEILASLALDRSDIASAQYWLSAARETKLALPTFMSHAIVYALEARLAFESEDQTMLTGEAFPQSAAGPLMRVRRARQALLASQLARATLTQDVANSPQRVTDLEKLTREMMTFGGQDYPMAVLLRCLLDLGRDCDARSLLTEYLHDRRRDRTRLTSSLANLVAKLEVPFCQSERRLHLSSAQ